MHIHLQSPPPRVGRVAVPSASTMPLLTRRSLCAAAFAVPASAVAVATLGITSPFRIVEGGYRDAAARLQAAASFELTDRRRFDAVEAEYLSAYEIVNAAPVRDWNEFVAAFAIATDDGTDEPRLEVLAKLLADARRLAKMEG